MRASKKASHNVTSTIISLNATSATAVRPMNDNGCQHLVPMIHIDDRHQAAIGFFIEAVKRRPTRTLISLKLFFPPMAVTRHDKKRPNRHGRLLESAATDYQDSSNDHSTIVFTVDHVVMFSLWLCLLFVLLSSSILIY